MSDQGVGEAMFTGSRIDECQSGWEGAGLKTRVINRKRYFLDSSGLYVPVEKYRRRGDLIDSPNRAAEAFSSLKHECDEHVAILVLDVKLHLLFFKKIASGTVNFCYVMPADIFREVIAARSVSFVLGHNHPSGDVNPGETDKELTRRIQEGAGILGLKLLDHIIVGGGCSFFSFTEHGLLNSALTMYKEGA